MSWENKFDTCTQHCISKFLIQPSTCIHVKENYMMILNVVNIRIIVMNVLYTKSYFEIKEETKRIQKYRYYLRKTCIDYYYKVRSININQI